MEEREKYNPVLIPRRDSTAAMSAVEDETRDAAGGVSVSDAGFADIEIDFNIANASISEKAVRFYSAVTPPEPIEQKTLAPIRLKFFDMRRLATDRPFARDDSELFYKQAKFMVDFTDDYKEGVKLLSYYPNYQNMGYEQLRTYFTWRTKVRDGGMPHTSASYVFLYAYELLNNIGVDSPAEGLDKLTAVWNTCIKFTPALENYMPMWLKDYHIYYDLPHSFAGFAKEHGLLKYYSVSFLFEQDIESSLEVWNGISSYDVTKSKFYNDGNEQLFSDCFCSVLESIRELCANNNTSIEELFIYSISKRMPWRPFKHALFYHWYRQPDRNVEMPGHEHYFCKNNQWSTNLPMYYSTQKEFIGYILKKTEACLRQAVKYKYKLKAEPDFRYHEYFKELKEIDDRRAGLDSAIEKAVADFHRNLNRTIVTVDHVNLDRIRMEALGTQEKLIVPEDSAGEFGARVLGSLLAAEKDRADDSGRQWHSDSQSGTTDGWDSGDGAELFGTQSTGFEIAGYDNGWRALKQALSEVELETLSLLLSGDADIKAFADKNGIMLEVLADSINEKSADIIGDSILEIDGEMTIYEEYREHIAKSIHGSQSPLT